MWCKSLTLEKYISFFAPFLSVSPFLLLKYKKPQIRKKFDEFDPLLVLK